MLVLHFVAIVAALSLYMYIALMKSLNFDPLHATVQLGEAFNLVKFKLARFYILYFIVLRLSTYIAILCHVHNIDDSE